MNKIIWRRLGKNDVIEIGDVLALGDPNDIYKDNFISISTIWMQYVPAAYIGLKSRKAANNRIWRPEQIQNNTKLPKVKADATEQTRKIELDL